MVPKEFNLEGGRVELLPLDEIRGQLSERREGGITFTWDSLSERREG